METEQKHSLSNKPCVDPDFFGVACTLTLAIDTNTGGGISGMLTSANELSNEKSMIEVSFFRCACYEDCTRLRNFLTFQIFIR